MEVNSTTLTGQLVQGAQPFVSNFRASTHGKHTASGTITQVCIPRQPDKNELSLDPSVRGTES